MDAMLYGQLYNIIENRNERIQPNLNLILSRERLVDGASQKSPCHTFLIFLLQVQHHEELLRVRGGDLLRPRVADEHGHPLQVGHAHQHGHHHDHRRQVPDGHQQQHQHHHLLLGRQAVQSCTLQSRLEAAY